MKKPENGEGFPKIHCLALVLNPDSSFFSVTRQATGKTRLERAVYSAVFARTRFVRQDEMQ
jgi:hypothetical protein